MALHLIQLNAFLLQLLAGSHQELGQRHSYSTLSSRQMAFCFYSFDFLNISFFEEIWKFRLRFFQKKREIC